MSLSLYPSVIAYWYCYRVLNPRSSDTAPVKIVIVEMFVYMGCNREMPETCSKFVVSCLRSLYEIFTSVHRARTIISHAYLPLNSKHATVHVITIVNWWAIVHLMDSKSDNWISSPKSSSSE